MGATVLPEECLRREEASGEPRLLPVARGVARNFASLAAGRFGSQLLAFVTNVYLARRVAPEGFGALALAQAAGAYLTIFADAGLSTIAVRQGAQNPAGLAGLIRSMTGLRSVLAVLVAAAGWVAADYLPYSETSRQILRIYALSLPVTALTAEWAFRALQKMHYGAMVQVLGATASLVLTLAWVRTPAHVVRAPVASLMSAALGAAAAAVLLRRCGCSLGVVFELRRFRSHLAEAAPLCASSLAITFYVQMNYFIVGKLCGEAKLGDYAAAARLATAFSTAYWLYHAAFGPAFMAVYANSAQRAAELFRHSVRLAAMVGGCLVTAGLGASPLFARLVYGAAYEGAAPVLRVLLAAAGVVAVSHNWTQLAIASRREGTVLKATVAGGVVNLMLSPLLVKAVGPAGAAAATLAAEVAVATVLIIHAPQAFRGPALRPIRAIGVACGAAVLVWCWTHALGPAVCTMGCAVAFGGVLMLTGGVGRQDYQLLRRMWSWSAGGAKQRA